MKKFFLLLFGLIFLAVPAHATLVNPTFIEDWKSIEDNCPFGDCSEKFKLDDLDDTPENVTYAGITFEFYQEDGNWMFDWSSEVGVCALLVKGGPNALLYDYTAQGLAFGDVGLHAPDNTNGKYYGLSNISGCSAVPEPATMFLLGTGLVGLAGFRKKFKK